MATRRQLGLGGEREENTIDDGSGFYDEGGAIAGFGGGGDGFAGAPAPSGGPTNPRDPFGNGRDRPDAFYNLSPEEQQAIIDMQNGAIAGSPESPRELFGGNRPTTPIGGGQPNLPRGVSVEETFDQTPSSYLAPEDGAGGAQDTPAMSMAPAPTAAQNAMPTMTATGPGSGTGPSRRSISNAAPALFAESGGGQMFGSADGLMGGGRGVLGANAGGPRPTEMMLSILRSLKGGS